ncbi:integrin-linked protein kinase 1-like protein [Tanacetum coccineum]
MEEPAPQYRFTLSSQFLSRAPAYHVIPNPKLRFPIHKVLAGRGYNIPYPFGWIMDFPNFEVLLSPELSPYSTKESLPWIPLDSSHLELWLCRGYPDIPDLLPVLVGNKKFKSMSSKGRLREFRIIIKVALVPLADALHYKNHDMVKLLEKHGAKPLSLSVDITKGTFTIASWRGTKVAVKKLGDELFINKDKGDLRLFLKRKGALKPITALKFAMDIARGMNYLHENKPEPIIHRDLEPSLIEECWHEKPDARPTFREIITRLESTYHSVNRRRRWKVRPLKWFQKVETIWKKEDSVRSSRDRSSHI